MNPRHVAAMEVMQVLIQVQRVMTWMRAEGENWPIPVQIYLGRFMIQVFKYATVAMQIIRQPTVILPPAGNRCIFY